MFPAITPDGQRAEGRKLMGIHQPEKCMWPHYDLDLWPLTLKTFSAMSTYMMNICVKFH